MCISTACSYVREKREAFWAISSDCASIVEPSGSPTSRPRKRFFVAKAWSTSSFFGMNRKFWYGNKTSSTLFLASNSVCLQSYARTNTCSCKQSGRFQTLHLASQGQNIDVGTGLRIQIANTNRQLLRCSVSLDYYSQNRVQIIFCMEGPSLRLCHVTKLVDSIKFCTF